MLNNFNIKHFQESINNDAHCFYREYKKYFGNTQEDLDIFFKSLVKKILESNNSNQKKYEMFLKITNLGFKNSFIVFDGNQSNSTIGRNIKINIPTLYVIIGKLKGVTNSEFVIGERELSIQDIKELDKLINEINIFSQDSKEVRNQPFIKFFSLVSELYKKMEGEEEVTKRDNLLNNFATVIENKKLSSLEEGDLINLRKVIEGDYHQVLSLSSEYERDIALKNSISGCIRLFSPVFKVLCPNNILFNGVDDKPIFQDGNNFLKDGGDSRHFFTFMRNNVIKNTSSTRNPLITIANSPLTIGCVTDELKDINNRKGKIFVLPYILNGHEVSLILKFNKEGFLLEDNFKILDSSGAFNKEKFLKIIKKTIVEFQNEGLIEKGVVKFLGFNILEKLKHGFTPDEVVEFSKKAFLGNNFLNFQENGTCYMHSVLNTVSIYKYLQHPLNKAATLDNTLNSMIDSGEIFSFDNTEKIINNGRKEFLMIEKDRAKEAYDYLEEKKAKVEKLIKYKDSIGVKNPVPFNIPADILSIKDIEGILFSKELEFFFRTQNFEKVAKNALGVDEYNGIIDKIDSIKDPIAKDFFIKATMLEIQNKRIKKLHRFYSRKNYNIENIENIELLAELITLGSSKVLFKPRIIDTKDSAIITSNVLEYLTALMDGKEVGETKKYLDFVIKKYKSIKNKKYIKFLEKVVKNAEFYLDNYFITTFLAGFIRNETKNTVKEIINNENNIDFDVLLLNSITKKNKNEKSLTPPPDDLLREKISLWIKKLNKMNITKLNAESPKNVEKKIVSVENIKAKGVLQLKDNTGEAAKINQVTTEFEVIFNSVPQAKNVLKVSK